MIKEALVALHIDAWIYEDDTGAHPETPRQTFLQEVEKANLFISIFWKSYRPYKIEEYEHALEKGKVCLIYEKSVDFLWRLKSPAFESLNSKT